MIVAIYEATDIKHKPQFYCILININSVVPNLIKGNGALLLFAIDY